jgi:peptide/nickel transport system substrate-binding protein
MKRILLSGVALVALSGASFAACPAVTVADSMGVAAGAYPQQYELTEFQGLASCTMEFASNPALADMTRKFAVTLHCLRWLIACLPNRWL